MVEINIGLVKDDNLSHFQFRKELAINDGAIHRFREGCNERLILEVFCPISGFVEAHSGLPQPNLADGIAAAITSLFSAGFFLPTAPRLEEDESYPRPGFYAWVSERLFKPGMSAEPTVIERVGKHLVRSFLKHNSRISPENERGMRYVIVRWLLDLPHNVLHDLPIPGTTRKRFRIDHRVQMLTAFGKTFHCDPFWRAIVSAVEGHQTTIESGDSSQFEILVPSVGQPRYRVPMRGPNLGPRTRLVEPILLALTGPVQSRRAYLSKRTDWFDMPEDRRGSLFRKIDRTKDPAEKVVLIEKARSESAEHFYRTILHKLRSRTGFNVDDLVPSAGILMQHLRLREELDFDARACRLIREVGLCWAIERFATLPITLPSPILRAITSVSPGNRRALVARLRRRLRTPLGRLHFAHVLLFIAGLEPTYIEETRAVVTELLDAGQSREQWKTFRILLEWARRSMLTSHEFRQLDCSTLLTLIWLHASRLHQMLAIGRASEPRVRKVFSESMEAFGLVADHSRTALRHDAAHPRRAGRLPVLLRGIGAALLTVPESIAAEIRPNVLASLPAPEHFTRSSGLLLRETSGLPNVLGSFLGGDAWPLFGNAIGSEAIATLLPDSPHVILSNALSKLTVEIKDIDAWSELAVTASDNLLTSELGSRLDQLIAGIDSATIDGLLRAQENQMLPFLAARCALTSATALRECCERHIFARAQEMGRSTEDESTQQRLAALFAGSLIVLAVVPENEAATHERMHKLLVRLLQTWPAVSTTLRTRFGGWPTHSSLACQRGLWELEMSLRAFS